MCNPCHYCWSSVISSGLLGGWISWISLLLNLNLHWFVMSYMWMRAEVVSLSLWGSRGHDRSVTCAQGLKAGLYVLLSFYTRFFQLQKERCNHYLCTQDSLSHFPVVKYQFQINCLCVMFPQGVMFGSWIFVFYILGLFVCCLFIIIIIINYYYLLCLIIYYTYLYSIGVAQTWVCELMKSKYLNKKM